LFDLLWSRKDSRKPLHDLTVSEAGETATRTYRAIRFSAKQNHPDEASSSTRKRKTGSRRRPKRRGSLLLLEGSPSHENLSDSLSCGSGRTHRQDALVTTFYARQLVRRAGLGRRADVWAGVQLGPERSVGLLYPKPICKRECGACQRCGTLSLGKCPFLARIATR